MKQQELPNKESGQACITQREELLSKITGIINDVTRELNTQPLVAIPIHTQIGDRLLLAVVVDEGTYCPIGLLTSTTELKQVVEEVYSIEAYKFVPQSQISGFREYSKEMLEE